MHDFKVHARIYQINLLRQNWSVYERKAYPIRTPGSVPGAQDQIRKRDPRNCMTNER